MTQRRFSRSVWAVCHECGTVWSEKNAHGVAVQHHDKTGHWGSVTVEMSYLDAEKTKTEEEQP